MIKRLAASHRGAIRVFQEVIHQLSDPHLDQMPPCYQELGQLIHKLALCSTLVGMTEGSAVAEMAFNIMLKLEVNIFSRSEDAHCMTYTGLRVGNTAVTFYLQFIDYNCKLFL